MRKFRLKSLEYFLARPMPEWGGDLSGIDFENIFYYIKPTEKQAEDLGRRARRDQEHLRQARHPRGRAEVPRRRRRPVRVRGRLPQAPGRTSRSKGVIFLDMDTALREHPDLVKQYFGTIIPPNDNKFAALNSAVWSGGSFVYVPPGVKVDIPLQAYFRINAENMGQFERTLIIVEEGAYVHYVEGCTAPIYSSDSLHSAVVEIIVKEGALPLHDDPELVEQRLQPRHQARRGLRGRDDGVGRRQPRLQADDEVPGGLADRRARPRRDPLDRLRRQGPAPGRGRQVRPRRAEHHLASSSRSRSARTAAAPATAGCSRSPRAPRTRSRRSSATR